MNFEYYATPSPFTSWLFTEMAHRGMPIVGRIFEPCVGDGAIIRAAALRPQEFGVTNTWLTNDLDERWPADLHFDASGKVPVRWEIKQHAFQRGHSDFNRGHFNDSGV